MPIRRQLSSYLTWLPLLGVSCCSTADPCDLPHERTSDTHTHTHSTAAGADTPHTRGGNTHTGTTASSSSKHAQQTSTQTLFPHTAARSVQSHGTDACLRCCRIALSPTRICLPFEALSFALPFLFSCFPFLVVKQPSPSPSAPAMQKLLLSSCRMFCLCVFPLLLARVALSSASLCALPSLLDSHRASWQRVGEVRCQSKQPEPNKCERNPEPQATHAKQGMEREERWTSTRSRARGRCKQTNDVVCACRGVEGE
jgi:hypothetical protein